MRQETLDCEVLATRASAQIANLVFRGRVGKKFDVMRGIIETAIRIALKRQREAFQQVSRN
jgi:hypothetical protein